MFKYASKTAAVAAIVCLFCSAAGAAEWGTLTGRFVLDGKAAAPVPIQVTKDQEVCGKHKLADESLIVGPKGELANVVVYLRTPKSPAIHPDYAKSAKQDVVLDNKNCRFEPHVSVLRAGQALLIKNSDPVGHNSKVDAIVNPAINVLIPQGGESEQKGFTSEEGLPVKVGCNIHPWMGGWVVIRNNPYAAVSDEKGAFKLENVPAGTELEFQIWQEKSGYLKGDSKQAKIDAKGRFKIKLKAGNNDLGDIKVPPSAMNK